MQTKPTYQEDISNLNQSIRQYSVCKLRGKNDKKQEVKSEIFGWYQKVVI